MFAARFCLFASTTLCCAALSAKAGPDDRLRTPPPARPPLDLQLQTREAEPVDDRVPAAVISPIFRSYVGANYSASAQRTFHTDNMEDLANEQLARAAEQRAYAASLNSGACLAKTGDNVGAGVRWSLNDGFGVYWQGKGLRALQKLVGFNEINAICPPGDASPMCRTMPKQVCD